MLKEKNGELEAKAEIIHNNLHRDKEKKNMKTKLRDKEDRMWRSNICLIIVLEGENGKRQCSEVLVDIFPKLMKDLN